LFQYCGEFFSLFSALVTQYREECEEKFKAAEAAKTEVKLPTVLNIKELLLESIERMKAYQCVEKQSSIFEDKVMVGYLTLVREFFMIFVEDSEYEETIELINSTDLAHELFFENLYYVPGKTRSLTQNKCKHKNTRTIAYKLMYRTIKAMKPKEVCVFLEGSLWPMIKDLDRPTKWRHQPSDKTRTVFAGINNLGCICYMISMLQQFYMIPQFRYLLLQAEDNKPVELKEYKGRQVDDNLLHQLQKMFGFLEKTER